MKILDTTAWSDTSEFPVKKGTVDFLQLAHKEIVGACLQALLNPGYNPATVYVLFGVQNSGTGPFYNISAGAIYYQGEVYLVDSVSFTAIGSNVGIFQIVISQYTTNADPVTFTDLAVRNVHNIRKMQVVQGASGSGIADFSAAAYPNMTPWPKVNITADPTAGNQLSVSGTYPNIELLVPGTGNLCPVLTDGQVHVGDVPSGGITIPIAFTNPSNVGTANYRVMLTLVSQGGSVQNDTSVSFSVIESSKTATGFSIRLQEWFGVIQSIAIDYIVFAKHNP